MASEIDSRDFNSSIKEIECFSKTLHDLGKKDANDLYSPVCIHAFLTLLSSDPWFYNKESFMEELYSDLDTILTDYKDIMKVFGRIRDLVLANIFFAKQCKISEDFKSLLKDNFASKLQFLDFTKWDDVAAEIKAWVHDRTLREMAPLADLHDDGKCAFVSATRYKGDFVQAFSVEDTATSTFHLNNQDTTQVQMMRKKGDFYYEHSCNFGAKILKLPFSNSDVSLVVVLPEEAIDNGVIYVPYTGLLTQYTKHMTKHEVDVSLPKFKLDETFDVGQYLKHLYLEDMLSARLTGVVEGEEIACKKIQQKSYLEVNEVGSEAVAGMVSVLSEIRNEVHSKGLIIYEANIFSEITNRFAKTEVVWRVKNSDENAADANFKVILTNTAFITGFVMEIKGTSYKSYVREKEEVKKIYNEAMESDESADLVESETRDSRQFTVSVNLEPDTVAVFSLTYEEMLERVHDQYELVLNICPGQIIEDLNIEVRIKESRSLKFVKTPLLRSGKNSNTSQHAQELDPQSDIKIINQKTATVKFRPDILKQSRMTHFLGNKLEDGLSGQFVVQYDVERDPINGEVLLQDGYFVHFFAPNDLDPLPTHVVFVLDTSESMGWSSMNQVKDAMMNILDDLRAEDMLSIIEFNNDVIVWDVDARKSITVSAKIMEDFKEPFAYLQECIQVDPHLVSDSIIEKAKEMVQNISADGCTFMIGGLATGLYLVKRGQQKNNQRLQPIIVFLTDGQPTVGVLSKDEIVELVTQMNMKDKVPIFSLSVGDYSDKNFLRKLSLNNSGFSRHTYEGTDASLQLQACYRQISSPLLRDIKFKYDMEVGEVTRTRFPIYFRGSELIVAGKCGDETFPTAIDCLGSCGPITIESALERPVTSLERLWAYITVKQLLDERDSSENPEELTKKAVSLALKYSFVTDVTSLMVVKPNETAPAFEGDDGNFECSTGNCLLWGPEGFVFHDSMHASVDDIHSQGPECSMGPDLMGANADDIHCQDTVVNSIPKKPMEEFTANRPFFVFLQVEVDDTILILFQGCVNKPIY